MSSGVYNKYTGYHNRRSIRLQGYDYSKPGYYFITICIHDMKQYLFGDIVDGIMVNNEFGEFAKRCWQEIPKHFPIVCLDEFVIMPNHIHGILRLNALDVGVQNIEPLRNASNQHIEPRQYASNQHIESRQYASNQNFEPKRNASNRYQHIIPGSIGSIIRGFKIGVTKLVRQQIPNMVLWQRNYYEHIIRDAYSLFQIRKYIRKNPKQWHDDSNNHINDEIKKSGSLCWGSKC